jgi:hypothetical protein
VKNSEPIYCDPGEENKPYIYFSKFIDHGFLDLILGESILYANQKYGPGSTREDMKLITVDNIKKYIAIYLTMGIVKVPDMEFYWSNSELFESEFSNNEGNEFSNDKLVKISPVVEYLNRKWTEYSPPNMFLDYTIDESMMYYRGRLAIRQFIPKKPNKYGIKIYCLASSRSGYIKRWIVYTGAKHGGCKPYEVVEQFSQFMPECSHVYFDSHFSSARDFYKLNKMNIYFTASVAPNRKLFPKL